jgi:alpha-N-arabinofuranosidase
MRLNLLRLLAPCLLGTLVSTALADTLRVDVSQPTAAVEPSLYGIFFEEINHAGDGGLYAEMIQNRSFEEILPVEGCVMTNEVCFGPTEANYRTGSPKKWQTPWKFTTPWPSWSLEAAASAGASLTLATNNPVHFKNINFLRLTATKVSTNTPVRLLNEGYWGIAVQTGETYRCSFIARLAADGFGGQVKVGVVGADGQDLGSVVVKEVNTREWHRHTASFKAKGTDAKARFYLQPLSSGSVDLDVISLFPARTFKNRANGLRADLGQLLADLKPAFMRFPGGCVVEGATFANRYRWKDTLGDISVRPGHWSLWGYRNTDGLGYHEFLQLCEDIGADGMYVCNVGLSCEWRNGDYLAEARLQEQIQDTLDAVEYALGGPETTWGSVRVRNGHRAPFRLKYLEIGNENHGPLYEQYYNRFAAALRQAWPQLVLIINDSTRDIGPGKKVQNVDLLDEHYYKNADWLFDQAGLYDKVPRDRGYGLYVGEFACNKGVGKGNLLAALSEAAFMMGMERNGDLVKLCSYAPLFFNTNRLDWPVNMIGYNNSVSFGRTTYHAQKLMAENRPDTNLKHEFVMADPQPASHRVFAQAGLDRSRKEIILKAVNATAAERPLKIELQGATPGVSARVSVLAAASPEEENSIDEPRRIVPRESVQPVGGPKFEVTLAPWSFSVIRVPVSQ